MSPLDRKLVRTLWRLKGQAAAIAVVIAFGVMSLVMMTGLVDTLDDTRATYYDRYRMADVIAPTVRAPVSVLTDLAQLPGVAAVQGRVVGGALISLKPGDDPIRAQAVSIPRDGRPQVNDHMLISGRAPAEGRDDEVLILDSFAKAHDLPLGATLTATMNGARRSFVVVGTAQSPEFIYISAPGELVPDDARFAVLWMRQDALEAAFDMKGAFNEALLKLSRNVTAQDILAKVDRRLDRYGGLGAYGVENQTSNRFVTEEIAGLRASAAVVPPIFLGVAAFLLYIVIARMVQSEREQIGIMKAFGYTSFEISLHYLKMVLAIAVAGALLGDIFGVVAGRAMAGLYQVYYKFPFLVFKIDVGALVIGALVSVAAASTGAMLVLRSVFRLAPAIAMRPPAPKDYSRAGTFGPLSKRFLDQSCRMIIRRLLRQPGRVGGAVLGVAAGMALSVGMVSILAGFDKTIDFNFSVIDRSDAMISFSFTRFQTKFSTSCSRWTGSNRWNPCALCPPNSGWDCDSIAAPSPDCPNRRF